MGELVLANEVSEAAIDARVAAYFTDVVARKTDASRSFDALRRDLEVHGAPAALIERARRASDENVHHARIAAALVLRFGGTLTRSSGIVETAKWAARPLGEVARENAKTRCVRGACSAALAGFQAHHAELSAVRHAMARIAYDEERHVALVWRVHAWACGVLGAAGRAWLQRAIEDQARTAPIDDFVTEDARLARALGLPRAEQARAIVAGMLQALAAG
jgi:hypothetical protein